MASTSRKTTFTLVGLFWSFTAGFVVAAMASAAVAYWITKAPIPFVAKVHQSEVSVDPALLDGKSIDPNKKLYADGQGADQTTAAQVATVTAGDAGEQINTDRFWVEAGAFSQSADAESMRARIAFIGLDAQIQYRNENGRRLYRVRIGPFESNKAAEEIRQSLADNSIQGTIKRLK